jgi:hypothetical protein
VDHVKHCDHLIRHFVRLGTRNLLTTSWKAAEIIFEQLSWQILEREAYSRIDALVMTSQNQRQRVEIKFISRPSKNRTNLVSQIRHTLEQWQEKELDILLIITLTQKYVKQSEGFLRSKEQCLVGIVMTSQELKDKTAEEVAAKYLAEMQGIMDENEEETSLTIEEIASTNRKLDEIKSDLQAQVTDFQAKVAELDQKITDVKVDQKSINADQKTIKVDQETMKSTVDRIALDQVEIKKDQAEIKKLLETIIQSLGKKE